MLHVNVYMVQLFKTWMTALDIDIDLSSTAPMMIWIINSFLKGLITVYFHPNWCTVPATPFERKSLAARITPTPQLPVPCPALAHPFWDGIQKCSKWWIESQKVFWKHRAPGLNCRKISSTFLTQITDSLQWSTTCPPHTKKQLCLASHIHGNRSFSYLSHG